MSGRKWPKKRYLAGIVILCICLYFGVKAFLQVNYTVTLTDPAPTEEIQPVFGTVTVRSPFESGVVFTDAENPSKRYVIEYIAFGREKIKLERGHWYTVDGPGNLTVYYVNVREK